MRLNGLGCCKVTSHPFLAPVLGLCKKRVSRPGESEVQGPPWKTHGGDGDRTAKTKRHPLLEWHPPRDQVLTLGRGIPSRPPERDGGGAARPRGRPNRGGVDTQIGAGRARRVRLLRLRTRVVRSADFGSHRLGRVTCSASPLNVHTVKQSQETTRALQSRATVPSAPRLRAAEEFLSCS